MKDVNNTVLVGFDYSKEDANPILIVGRKYEGKPVEIIKMFQGKEAVELWGKLTITEEK